MEVSTVYKSSSAAVLAASSHETCTYPSSPNQFDAAASTAADDDLYRVETCTDPCVPNRFDKPASAAADYAMQLEFFWNRLQAIVQYLVLVTHEHAESGWLKPYKV